MNHTLCGRFAAAGLALAILAGCSSGTASPAPTGSEGTAPGETGEVYTRLSEEPMTELVVSDSYGPLLPYLGVVGSEEERWAEGKYGLVTREGMVVTDPIYEEAYRPTWYDYDTEQNRAMEILCLEQSVGEGENTQSRCGLAALDGSWFTGFNWLYLEAVDAEHIWAIDLNFDGVMLDGKGDTQWRLSMTGENWDGNAVCWFGEWGIIPSDPYAIIDLEGHVTYLTGENAPRDPTVFCDGLSMAYPEGDYDNWGYINTAGEWVIEPQFASGENFHNGLAIVTEQGDGTAVIDTEGNIRLSADGHITCRSSSRGDWYVNYANVDGWKYFIGGAYDDKLSPVEWDWIGQTVEWGGQNFFAKQTETGLELSNPYETIFLPAGENAYLNTWVEDLLVCTADGADGKSLWSVWKDDGTCLFGAGEKDYFSLPRDNATGELYIISETAGTYCVYDRDGNYLTQCESWPYIQDGLISMDDEDFSGYMTLDGEWIFRIALKQAEAE